MQEIYLKKSSLPSLTANSRKSPEKISLLKSQPVQANFLCKFLLKAGLFSYIIFILHIDKTSREVLVMNFKRLLSLLLLFCFLFNLAGCKPEDFKLYYEMQSEIATLDPQLAQTDSELLLIKNIYEGLYRLDADGNPVAGAADCEISKNGLQYTFTLRKGAQWSDGTPLTADDFVFGIERALSGATASPYAQSLFCIQNAEAYYNGRVSFNRVGIEMQSDRKLTITLHTAYPEFPFVLASACAMPCNRSFFQNTNGRYGLDKASVLSNGSFYLQYWDEQNGLVLHKDADYNGDFSANAYAVNLSVAKDSDTAGRLLEKNIDGGRILYSEEHRLPTKDFRVQKFPVSTYALIFNAGMDKELRSILMQAADFTALQKELADYMSPSDSLIPPTLTTKGAVMGYPAYDSTAARSRFLQYTKTHTMPSLKVLCIKDDNFSVLLKQIIAYWQDTLGAYDINIEYVDTEAEMLERLQAKNYIVALAPFQDNGGKIYDFLFPFAANAPQNYLNRTAGRFEKHLADYSQSSSNDALQKAIQALSAEELLVPICTVNKIYAISSDYENAVFFNFGGEIDFSMITK